MKTFEEKWTAWLDGELSGKELAEFEASLPDKAAAEAEKREAKKLGAFLKEQLASARPEQRGVFQSSTAGADRARSDARPSAGETSVLGLVDDSASGLGGSDFARDLYSLHGFGAAGEKHRADQSQYLTQILNARVDPAVSPDATISIFESKEDKVTVLWTEGLQSLPAEYAAK